MDVPFCLVLFDLDDFKVVNGTYGHLADIANPFQPPLFPQCRVAVIA